jgi:phospholipid/cholesterol/gamma-HCH transport system permease protein
VPAAEVISKEPHIEWEDAQGAPCARLSGHWIATHARLIQDSLKALQDAIHKADNGKGGAAASFHFDLSRVERLDTLGAWCLLRSCAALGKDHHCLQHAPDEQSILIEDIARHDIRCPSAPPPEGISGHLADLGEGIVNAGKNLSAGIAFLGEVIVALGGVILHPKRLRITSIVHQMEAIALQGVPIIMLITFLVGCIVAQQGIFQLQKFGAAAFAVDLVGILVLRELGVLLTAIMVAGRSGSAFTAEIGSMKMREEIDALRVMGLDPMDVLILPRIIALIISVPLLTFLAMMAALYGGGLVAWIYGNISPDVFMARLQASIKFNTFMVGLIKAPFMALIIGLIASMEGMKVKGSAESLGTQVTSSVVKSIFMVIVIDGIFAMFFAAIRY